jgi:glycerol-3-phosphate acyltransferase PlsX
MGGSRTVVAIDAMGGDRAPEEIVAGAVLAAREVDVDVLLVGREDAILPLLPADRPAGLEVLHASEVVEMDDPATAVRRKKDASIVRCAEAVRDGRAAVMVSAGNTGGAMAAALLRMGRIKGVARPAIAAPIPVPGSTPTLLVDAGATVDCQPEWLVQFARMGAEYAQVRYGIDKPRVGLLSVGEEPGKGDEVRKAAHALLGGVRGFIGNVEGRDIMTDKVDVVVTDGFTGNVALKSLEGALKAMVNLVLGVLVADEHKAAGETILPALLEAASPLQPDNTGGAVLLGVDGVCVISHGSSSARAIVNAVRVGAGAAAAGVVDRLKEAIAHAG